ncbi:MAG: hypothetical protein QGD90_01000 [Candidatus Hydrogenedentes bacterium]|nr:hypothetical protein [Candidatus Hydrogenedentota bacterium]
MDITKFCAENWARWAVDFLEIAFAFCKGYPLRKTWRYLTYCRALEWADAMFADDATE